MPRVAPLSSKSTHRSERASNVDDARAVLVTALLTAFPVHSVDAQSKLTPLTNADVFRLVTMRVSEQTVIAVIDEPKAKEFVLTTFADTELSVSGVSTPSLSVQERLAVF